MALRREGVSLSRRLGLITVGLLAVGLTMGTLAMTVVLGVRLMATVDDELRSTAQRINGIAQELASTTPNSESFRDGFVLILYDASGEVIQVRVPHGTSPQAPMPDFDAIDPASTVPTTVLSSTSHGPSWRVLSQPVVINPGGNDGYVTVALSLQTVDATLSDFVARVVLVDVAIIIAGGLLAYGLVKRSLRPLREIERTAGAIAAGDLSQRVPEGPPETETGSLAHSLNVMLTHIERSFDAQRASEERMRRFVSDASHELRTPLATVQGYGELYRLGGIPDEELPGAIGRMESEAQRMGGLVADLLQLARLDEGHPLRHAPVNITSLAADAVADMKALDPERPARLVGLDGGEPGPVLAIADEDRIRQILSNLIGNAVQHSPAATPVEIAVGMDESHAIIEVRDHGPGVPSEHLERIFGRFHRVDTSRSRASGGTGLGLAIVAAILQAHHGSVKALETAGGGLTIHVAIPRGTNGLEGAAESG